ncbi:MAG: carboxylesterase family protein [Planctomycetota bacterium]
MSNGRMNAWDVLVAALILCGAPAWGQDAAPGGRERPRITADDYLPGSFTTETDYTLKYRLFVPEGVEAGEDGKRYPMVVFLHGRSRKGLDNRKQITTGSILFALPEQQKERPCFVLAPQCPPNDGWGRNIQMEGYPKTLPGEALQALIDQVIEDYPVDEDRLYITGQSGGGGGTLHALTRAPKRFAAAAIVCPGGRHTEEKMKELAGKFGSLPLWFFHGDKDQLIDVAHTRLWVKVLREAGYEPRYTEYPGVKHNSWEKAYREPDLGAWLFAQRRGD